MGMRDGSSLPGVTDGMANGGSTRATGKLKVTELGSRTADEKTTRGDTTRSDMCEE